MLTLFCPQPQSLESEQIDASELKTFVQAHVPDARMKEAQGGDLVYSLPPFNSSNASSYRSLLTALDANLDDLQLGGYGISDTTLEEVSSHMPHHMEACTGISCIHRRSWFLFTCAGVPPTDSKPRRHLC